MGQSIQSTERAFCQCAQCGREYRWRAVHVGKQAKCACGHIAPVPNAPSRVEGRPAPVEAEDGLPSLDAIDLAPEETERVASHSVARPPVARPSGHRAVPVRAASPGRARPTEGGGWLSFLTRGRIKSFLGLWYIYGPICLVGGIILIVFSYNAAQAHAKFMVVAQEMTATIAGPADINKGGGSAATRTNPERWTYTFPVEYFVGRQAYREFVSVRGESKLPPECDSSRPSSFTSQTIDILYDPNDPAHVESSVGAKAKDWTLAYLLGGAFVVIGAGLLVNRPS